MSRGKKIPIVEKIDEVLNFGMKLDTAVFNKMSKFCIDLSSAENFT